LLASVEPRTADGAVIVAAGVKVAIEAASPLRPPTIRLSVKLST
jgi:hypothetical protein